MANPNNLKSYLFALLLFLLRVHQSLSFPPLDIVIDLFPIGKAANLVTKNKDVRDGIRVGGKLYKEFDNIRDMFSPPSSPSPPVEIPPTAPAVEIPPTTPAVEIDGLSVLKQYFSDFGYIKYSDSFTNKLDTETKSAIETYQHFFNLENNGQLDEKTITQLTLPRCAVPDLNFDYELTSTNKVSWPKGKWFPSDTKVLTYGFLPASDIQDEFKTVFKDAFNRWSEAITEMNILTKLNFTEKTYDTSDIKIGFYTFNRSNDIEDLVVGGTIVRFQNDNPDGDKRVGDIRLDGTMYWALPSYSGTLSSEDGEFDLETVAMHQIGHLLGLNHSSDESSIMYPSILTSHQKKVQLSDDDKKSIQQIYGDTNSGGGGGRFTLFGSSTLLLATLSLGISVLLY